MSKCHYIVLFLFTVIVRMSPGNCQPIPCDDRLWLLTAPSAQNPTEVKQILFKNNQVSFSTFTTSTGAVLNAAGYSVQDGFIYGIDGNTYELYRIDGNGHATKLGIPQGLDLELEYYAGAVNAVGRTLFIIGRTKDTKIDRKLFSIGLRGPAYRAGYVSIVSDWQTKIEDMAHDPVLGIILGYDSRTKKLVTISEGGAVTSINFEQQLNISTIGALFYDAKGDLYGYGGAELSETQLYKFNKNNGKAVQVASGPDSRITDGCSCPYRFEFKKTVTPQQTLPCAEVVYRYHILNTAGAGYTNLELRDTFPEGFVIQNLKGIQAYSEIISGIGSNILHVKLFDLYLGENEIEITVQVSEQPGTYPSQCYIGAMPMMLGGQLVSDNPADERPQSPTLLTIIDEKDVLLASQVYLCTGGVQLLHANTAAKRYQWSTGDTTQAIQVDVPGTYTVIAYTDCGEFKDEITVLSAKEPLYIDLEDITTIEQGDVIQLNYATNAQGKVSYRWSTDANGRLSCVDCTDPSATPLMNTTYTVTITDSNGCQAGDSIQVAVLPVRNIFAPGAFSPNNDGVNDIFYLQGKGDAKIIYLRIFDRWGNQVFENQNGNLNDPSVGWNGTLRGKLLANQPFLYLAEIEFLDGLRKRLSGEVSLFR